LLWSKESGFVDLGTLPGGTFSFAHGINRYGQVVGLSSTAAGCCRAFRWTKDSGMEDLGTLPGYDSSTAFGINDNGQVVGESDDAIKGCCRPFLWTKEGGIQDLGLLPNAISGIASAISNGGTVVGPALLSTDATFHSFIWTDKGQLTDLGVRGASAVAINKGGYIVGGFYCLPASCSVTIGHAFIMHKKAKKLIDLGTLPGQNGSYAEGINRWRTVIGYSGTFDIFGLPNSPFPFFWTPKSDKMWNLNDLIGDSDWVLYDAKAVNDRNEIIGVGTLSGEMHAFLLTPGQP
jgi:probable HAF family extracellular repeat protein